MRSDYALYAVAVIFFILAGIICVYPVEYGLLWIAITVILAVVFIWLGYTQRPKEMKITTVEAPSPAAPVTVPVTEEKREMPKVTPQVTVELTEVKGVGAKRAEQLKAIGIVNVEDLAKASAEDLASKLNISQKIAERIIENAKKLVQKT